MPDGKELCPSDPLAPERVAFRAIHGDFDYVPLSDYRALWDRCQKAERERDARAEVGYAVQAESLRKQLRQQRQDFDRRVTELKARAERAESQARELAGAVERYLKQRPLTSRDRFMEDALAWFRGSQTDTNQEETKA